MGGFLKHVLIPADFQNRVVNIHPALIPHFSGQGFYGHHVHEAVLAAGVQTSGCTVHFVDNLYDHGPIILQRGVPVLPATLPTRWPPAFSRPSARRIPRHCADRRRASACRKRPGPH